MKKVIDFLLSLQTAIWLIIGLLLFLLFGSFIMPLREEFQSMSYEPLFSWMKGNSPGITWWLWLSIGVLALLTLNTIFCSVESIIKKKGSRHWLLLISPQIMHLGFLFILLAHLFSSFGSVKGMAYVYKGTALRLTEGLTVVFDDINAEVDPSGYVTDWSASIRYLRDRTEIRSDIIRPNSPSFEDGFGIYIKSVQLEPFPSALIEASREPGASWALFGGILFLAGMATLLIFKMKIEEAKA